MTNQNTLYLCGFETTYHDNLGTDYIVKDFVKINIYIVSALTRNHARSLLCSHSQLDEFIHPMTIRKIGVTDRLAGVYEDDELMAAAFEIVSDFEVPSTFTSDPEHYCMGDR